MKALAFLIVNKQVADIGPPKAFGRFVCRECPAQLDIPLTSPLNPEKMCHFAAKNGWSVVVNKPTAVFCPACQGPRRPTNALLDIPKPIEVEMPVKPVEMPKPIEVRQPTSEERVRIRNFLDKSFDDAAGCYLDDMSDIRVAELVGVPRIVVERLRETAYGPLLLTPEMIKLRVEMVTLKEDIGKLTTRAAELSSQLEQMIARRA